MVRSTLRFVAAVLTVSGLLLITDAGATLLWQEPVSWLLVELYARSAEEASEVLAGAARGVLAITSLAEESRPPASGGGDGH